MCFNWYVFSGGGIVRHNGWPGATAYLAVILEGQAPAAVPAGDDDRNAPIRLSTFIRSGN